MEDEMFKVLKFDAKGQGNDQLPLDYYERFDEYTFKQIQAAKASNASLAGFMTSKTALAVSDYARGSQWCVTSPRTAQQYLDSGPLYLVFKNGEKYMLCNHSFTDMRDVNDVNLSTPGQITDIFLSRLVKLELPLIAKKNILLRRMKARPYPNRPPIEMV
jgi:hypothetical protein